jgi:hypothetical protein
LELSIIESENAVLGPNLCQTRTQVA